MRDFMNRMQELWCAHMHAPIMWPIHGKYRCATCMREYAVTFERATPAEMPARMPAWQAERLLHRT